MTLTKFGIVRATDFGTPPADSDFKVPEFQPMDMPQWEPHGERYRTPSGTDFYFSLPYFTVRFPGLLYYTNSEGVVGGVGTVVELYSEYRLAQRTTEGRCWVTRWSPELDDFEYVLCIPQWANYSGKVSAVGVVNFEMTFLGVGLNLPDYGGGEPFPPDGGGDDSGDPFQGSFGYGPFGSRGFGQGGF